MQFQEIHFTPSSTLSIPPHKSPQNKIQPSFLYGGQRASRGKPCYMQNQSHPHHQVPIRQQELQLKTKVEIPAHCDTQVR